MSNSKIRQLNNEMKKIDNLISNGNYQEALNAIKSVEKENLNNKSLQTNIGGFLIDIGSPLKDEKIVREGIEKIECFLDAYYDEKLKVHLYYNLGNGYLALYNILEYGKEITRIPKNTNLQKAKKHFRKAMKFLDEFGFNLKKRLLTNYGNCLDNLGRYVESLYIYDDALKIDPNYSMAIGNKALAMCFFANISGRYREEIYVSAHQLIKSIINKEDLIEIGGRNAKVGFENKLEKIESLFKDQKVLEKKIEHKKYDEAILSDFEKFYLDFCSKEKLFLNFHIHDDRCESAVIDPIFIQLITDINDNHTFYNLAKHINQIKEDFAVARLLLVQSQYKRKDFDSISQRTTFVDCLDYSKFNIYTGLLKSAFKNAFNILDKIAIFINEYLGLNLDSKDIFWFSRHSDFKWNVWENENGIRDSVVTTENINLYALYDVYQDFKSRYYEDLSKIRHTLTNRVLVLFDSRITTENRDIDKMEINDKTMLNETVNLFRLVKSAIIYLINFVNTEEKKKRSKIDGLIGRMYIDTTQYL